jgi:XTP/dITP diphosphohydrolase
LPLDCRLLAGAPDAGADGPVQLILASGNPGKAAEIADVLAGVEVVARPAELPEPVEDGETLLDNARIKARAVVDALGVPALADDTGLEVVALGGAPGVLTARYAGEDATYEDNWRKLLAELGDEADRRARWRTVALALWPDGTERWVEGTCDGVITHEARGEHGFGYDPVFVPQEGDGRTFAELSRSEKNALSHRGRAFRALRDLLADDVLKR